MAGGMTGSLGTRHARHGTRHGLFAARILAGWSVRLALGGFALRCTPTCGDGW